MAVATAAFLLYWSTLLPGFDLGDTASFQTMAGSPVISPRDGYPLYYAIGGLFVWLSSGDPAQTMNLASAVESAVACGLITLLAAELSGSLAAGVIAAVLFSGSYTFWSQAVIAEVYALHVCLIALTLLLLLRWATHPSTGHLAAAFAAYAVSFGNHLTMILLAPAYAGFLLASAPRGWRSMFEPRVLALALAAAAIGALQYLWNFRTLWMAPVPPPGLSEALQTFWFDITKADWREAMVWRVPISVERLQMYLFDLRQQFGLVSPWIAAAGAVHLLRTHPRRAGLMVGLYVVTLSFALGYNVGDAHVFFLPSHLMLALLTAPGIVLLGHLTRARGAVASIVLVLVGMRIYRDYPALDRSADHRPTLTLAALTTGLDDHDAVLMTDLNWQLQNGLTYFAEHIRHDVAYARLPDVMLYAPALIRDNLAIGRAMALTETAKSSLFAAYGPLYGFERDPRVPVSRLSDLTRGLATGTRYVLCVLRPSRDIVLDDDELQSALRLLSGDRVASLADEEYMVVAGLIGDAPILINGASRPFQTRVSLGGLPVTIRMDSWLAFDTIRRMGFGHVVAGRRHTLIVERGVSFVAIADDGRPVRTAYSGNIFAPQPRYLISTKPG